MQSCCSPIASTSAAARRLRPLDCFSPISSSSATVSRLRPRALPSPEWRACMAATILDVSLQHRSSYIWNLQCKARRCPRAHPDNWKIKVKFFYLSPASAASEPCQAFACNEIGHFATNSLIWVAKLKDIHLPEAQIAIGIHRWRSANFSQLLVWDVPPSSDLVQVQGRSSMKMCMFSIEVPNTRWDKMLCANVPYLDHSVSTSYN